MTARGVATFDRPAVFCVNRLGDQLMTLPAMRALCTLFPGGLQLLLGEDMRYFFYRGLPLSEPVVVRWSGKDQSGIDVARTAGDAAPCDLFVCLSHDPRSFVGPLAERLGARWTLGHGEGLDQRPADNEPQHAIDRVFAIPQCLDPTLRLADHAQPPVFSPAAHDAASRFLASVRRPWHRALFIHPETHPERMWERERWAWVLERFLHERPDYMVLVASLDPVDLGGPPDRVRWIDQHLELTLALMRDVDLFAGVDSCFLHAADLYRVPGVGLFGPTPSWDKGFRFTPDARHVSAASMAGIEREEVLEALLGVASAAPDARGGRAS